MDPIVDLRKKLFQPQDVHMEKDTKLEKVNWSRKQGRPGRRWIADETKMRVTRLKARDRRVKLPRESSRVITATRWSTDGSYLSLFNNLWNMK